MKLKGTLSLPGPRAEKPGGGLGIRRQKIHLRIISSEIKITKRVGVLLNVFSLGQAGSQKRVFFLENFVTLPCPFQAEGRVNICRIR